MNLAFATRAAKAMSPAPRALPDRRGAFPPLTAGALAVGAVGLAAFTAVLMPGPANAPRVKRWYDNLDKPAATPPDFVFGLVWPAIEAAMAYSGFRLLSKPSSAGRNGGLALLGFNVANLPGYTKLFFGDRNLKAAGIDTLAMTAAAWGYVATTWRTDRVAAVAGLPLAVWVTFASYLQGEILRRNDPDVRQHWARMAGA